MDKIIQSHQAKDVAIDRPQLLKLKLKFYCGEKDGRNLLQIILPDTAIDGYVHVQNKHAHCA